MCLSISVDRSQQWRAAGLLLGAPRAGDIDQQRRAPSSNGAAARGRCSKAGQCHVYSRRRRLNTNLLLTERRRSAPYTAALCPIRRAVKSDGVVCMLQGGPWTQWIGAGDCTTHLKARPAEATSAAGRPTDRRRTSGRRCRFGSRNNCRDHGV